MYKPVNAIEVRIWRRTVGAVALDPKLGYYAFEYDPAFIRSGIELAPLMMPLATADEPFVFPDLPENTYRRLPAMQADALPDAFGNNLIDAWMAREGVSKSRITSLDRLAYMSTWASGVWVPWSSSRRAARRHPSLAAPRSSCPSWLKALDAQCREM